jgi:serine/threonine protein kinase/tetratricopeptide (TPR) repeat protein
MLGQTLTHYRILEQLGAGGMGVVYRARDLRLDRDVALKVLPLGSLNDEGVRKRFRKEALTLSRLNHPNVATVYDFDTQDKTDFLVTEYIRGVTLDKMLLEGAASEKDISRLGVQLADGLAAAHGEGVVHRDLKPANLFITEDGRLKILDFGIAKLLQPPGEATITASQTEAIGVEGTLPYMSPEQLRSEKVDSRSDIWSAGAVLYEMATGRRAFPERVTAQLIDAILHKQPESLRAVNSKISPELERIVLKCLEKESEVRYQSARELSVDLRRLTSPTTVVAPVQPRRVFQRVPLLISLGTVGLAALLIGLNVGGIRDHLQWTAAPHGRVNSLAVLPIRNLSGDPSQDPLADVMTEDLTTELAQLSSVRVTSLQSSERFKKTDKPLPQIAKELGVDGIVDGSIQRTGSTVRVTAHLLYAPSDRHLWSKTYERPMSDIVVLEDEIARTVASEVGGTLNPAYPATTPSARKVDPAAYDLYLRGSSYLDEFDLDKSIDYLNQAIRVDPTYAPTYEKLGQVYFFLGFFNQRAPDFVFPKMKEAAENALSRDDTRTYAHEVLAVAKLHYDWDFPGAEKEHKRALELSPNDPDVHHLYSHYLLAVGRFEESAAESARAVEGNPIGRGLNTCLCWHLYTVHRYAESAAKAQKVVALSPNNDWALEILGTDYEQLHRYDEAISTFQKAVKVGEDDPDDLSCLAHGYAITGKKKEANEIIAKLMEISKHRYVSPFDIAMIYAGLGDKDTAFEWLEKAFKERSFWLIYLRWEPRLDPLRSDPRFSNLLTRMGLSPS